ncbi:MAG: Flagellar P-ring protein [Phycisphaerae bacterium]|nr:Flagellar P-ring protein [Phycisphaerae bacterium]
MFNRLLDSSAARRSGRLLLALAGAVALTAAAAMPGCAKPIEYSAPPVDLRPQKAIPSYDDTIGYYADTSAGAETLIRGFGLVLLPGTTGCSECPPSIRKIIYDQLNQMHAGESASVLSGVPLEKWIDDPKTAVVEVRGRMPNGAIKDQTFDVTVSALPGTQTTSLEGGVLITTELSLWRRGITGGLIHGETFAFAAGSVFVNPFAELNSPDTTPAPVDPSNAAGEEKPLPQVDPRIGTILGGARVIKDQPLFLTLRQADYQIAQACQDQINTAFHAPEVHRVAHARDARIIELTAPRAYRPQMDYWLRLIQQLYLRHEPGFAAQRMTELAKELTWPDCDRMRIALSYIGIGKPAISYLRTLYRDRNPSVVYYAAYAGLRLDDSLAMETLYEITQDKESPYRVPAILALGEPHRFRNIGIRLARLLSEEDPLVRIAAYQSIDRLGGELIQSQWIGLDKLGFRLDVVRCDGPYLVFVTRISEPRIVIFGGHRLKLMNPTMMASKRTGVTIAAKAGDADLSVFRADPTTDKMVQVGYETRSVIDEQTKLPVNRDVPTYVYKTGYLLADLIRALGSPPYRNENRHIEGFGLNYAQVVHVLYQLSKTNQIPSDIYLQPLSRVDVELAAEKSIADQVRAPADGDQGAGPTTRPDDDRPDIVIEAPGAPPKIGG